MHSAYYSRAAGNMGGEMIVVVKCRGEEAGNMLLRQMRRSTHNNSSIPHVVLSASTQHLAFAALLHFPEPPSPTSIVVNFSLLRVVFYLFVFIASGYGTPVPFKLGPVFQGARFRLSWAN